MRLEMRCRYAVEAKSGSEASLKVGNNSAKILCCHSQAYKVLETKSEDETNSYIQVSFSRLTRLTWTFLLVFGDLFEQVMEEVWFCSRLKVTVFFPPLGVVGVWGNT